MQIHFITIASAETRGLLRFRHSCALFGIEPTVLGLDKPYPGNLLALHYVADFLENCGSDDIVIYNDAYDVVMIRDKAGLEEAFHALERPIVFSCEAGFQYSLAGKWRQYLRYPKRARKSGMYRFLNGGGWMGRAGALRGMIGELNFDAETRSDQAVLCNWFLDNQDRCALDYDQRIFTSSACITGYEEQLYRFDGTHLRHTRTGAAPYFFHFPSENTEGSRRILDMLPFEFTRRDIEPSHRWIYARLRLENGLLYALDIPAFPAREIIRAVLYGAFPLLLLFVAIALAAAIML